MVSRMRRTQGRASGVVAVLMEWSLRSWRPACELAGWHVRCAAQRPNSGRTRRSITAATSRPQDALSLLEPNWSEAQAIYSQGRFSYRDDGVTKRTM